MKEGRRWRGDKVGINGDRSVHWEKLATLGLDKTFSKHPLTLVRAIILAYLMAVQSSGIFKILTKKRMYY